MILLNKYLSATSIFNIYVALLRHKMLRVPNVACAVIFDRRLGCADESATDDELADKVLFYYPPTTRLSDQLTKVNMLEGLIEFSNKFSSSSLDHIIMRDTTWGFHQCEPDIWLAVALDNKYGIEDQHIPLQTPNPRGLECAIETIYKFIHLFVVHGSMRDFLNTGWEHVLEVMKLRKKIRKLIMRSRQEDQDLTAMKQYDECRSSMVVGSDADSDAASNHRLSTREERRSEQLGIRQGAATVEELADTLNKTFSDITHGEEELRNALSKGFTPRLLSEKLTKFMNWYLGCGELLSPSFLHVFNGIHYAPMSRSCLPLMLQVRYGLEDALGPYYRGCTYLYNGQIALCEMDNEEKLSLLYNYIRLKEGSRIIDSANSEFNKDNCRKPATKPKREDKIKRILSFGRRSSSSMTPEASQSDQAIKGWLSDVTSAQGFVCRDWEESEDLDKILCGNVLDMNSVDTDRLLWCPMYHSDTGSHSEEKVCGIDGDRVVLYRHGRFIVIMLVAAEGLVPENCKPLMAQIQENLSSSLPEVHEKVETIFREHNASAESNSGSGAPPPSSPQTPSSRDKPGLRVPQIRIFYANECVKAIKVSGTKVWTPPLPKSLLTSPGARSNHGNCVTTAEQLFQDPLLYASVTRASMESGEHSSGITELSNDEVNALLAVTAAGAFKFSAPPAHTAVSIPPDVLSALNGLNESLSTDTMGAKIPGCKATNRESCTRVSAVDGGGKWVFARCRGQRRVFILVEGCSTLNEMYSVINDVFDGILGSVMI